MSFSTRRRFLAATGLATAGLASMSGCLGAFASKPDDVVAAVEFKGVYVTDARSVRQYVGNEPADGAFDRPAPLDLDLDIVPYEKDGPVAFPDSGPLHVSSGQARKLSNAYDDVEYNVVLTLYEPEDVAGVPTGNAYGYRIERTEFNRLIPGDRAVLQFGRRNDLPHVTKVVDVASAR